MDTCLEVSVYWLHNFRAHQCRDTGAILEHGYVIIDDLKNFQLLFVKKAKLSKNENAVFKSITELYNHFVA